MCSAPYSDHDGTHLTRALVAVDPRSLSKTNVGTETAFRHDHGKHIQAYPKKVNISEVRGQLIRSNSRMFSTTLTYMVRSEFTLVLNLDTLDAGRSPNAVRAHAGTTQVDSELDRLPPADFPPGDLLITMVQETVVLYKKFRKMKK